MRKITVHYFFRKPSPVKHSIERLFEVIAQHLPANVELKNFYEPFPGKGLFFRLMSAVWAAFHQGKVNHITGDIHFFAVFLRKSRTVLTIHDVEVLKRTTGLKHQLLKYFWFTMPVQRVAKVSVISDFSAKELIQFVPRVKPKLVIIPNAISKAYRFVPKQFNAERPVILQVGTKHNKNVERVAEALHGLSCKWLIIGQLSHNQQQLIARFDVAYQNFGHLTLQEVVALYEKCDFLLFASTYEGFGLPVLEAQAVGRPVICSHIASLPEVAGEAALYVNPTDIQDIRSKVMELISSEELRQHLVKQGLENVKRFSAEEVALQYYQVYEELLRN